MEQEELMRIARRRAGRKFGFYVHLAVFVAVNALLFAINQRATPGFSWFAFPLGGWAVGLAIHGFIVFLSNSGLRERMIEDELRKLKSRGDPGAP
ncbi:MAG: 2TM domain-containing protein [Burkholderiales bacterium]|nr:2TM domain-containing protein [Burkholderiales bacterium]